MPKRTTLSDVRGLVAQLQRLSRLASASGTVAITDVTGLTAALTAKADASHGHVAGDITDLDDVLNEYVTATELTAALSGMGGSGLTHPQVLARGLGA